MVTTFRYRVVDTEINSDRLVLPRYFENAPWRAAHKFVIRHSELELGLFVGLSDDSRILGRSLALPDSAIVGRGSCYLGEDQYLSVPHYEMAYFIPNDVAYCFALLLQSRLEGLGIFVRGIVHENGDLKEFWHPFWDRVEL